LQHKENPHEYAARHDSPNATLLTASFPYHRQLAICTGVCILCTLENGIMVFAQVIESVFNPFLFVFPLHSTTQICLHYLRREEIPFNTMCRFMEVVAGI